MKRSRKWHAAMLALALMLCPLGAVVADGGDAGYIGDCFPDEPVYTPDMPQYHCNEGGACYASGQYGLALEAFQRALDIDPEYQNAHYGLAYTYRAMGRLELAVDSYGEVIRLAPTYAQPYASRAELYRCMGRFDEARGDLDAYVRVYGQYPVPYMARGDFFMERRDYALAARDYAVAMERNPALLEAYVKCAGALMLLGDTGDALILFERAAQLAGGQ